MTTSNELFFALDYDLHEILHEYIQECGGTVGINQQGFHVPGLTLRSVYGQDQDRRLWCKIDTFKEDDWTPIDYFEDLEYYINKYGPDGSYFKKDCECR